MSSRGTDPAAVSAPLDPADRASALRCAAALLAALPAGLAEEAGAEPEDQASALMAPFSDGDLQLMMTACSRAYLHRATRSPAPLSPLLPGNGLTATEAMLLTSAILKAVDVAVFELGMWQAWSGRQ